MPLPDGLYKITLVGPQGTDFGVADLRAGRWRGGDSGSAYVGTYRPEGDVLTAELNVPQHRHVPALISALGYSDLVVQLEGVAGDYGAEVRGTCRDMPSMRFSARLAHIAD